MNVITQPTVEPVTLAEVRDQLGIQDTATETDAVITRRITEARAWAEGYLERSLMPQTLELRMRRFCDEIELEAPPVSAINSIKYIDINGTLQTVSSADYELDDFPRRPYVRPDYGTTWPSPRDERNAVRVQYSAGYGLTALAPATTITAITKATPGVLTSVAHGYADGDLVLLDIAGMTELDGAVYRVYAKTADTYQLANLANNGAISTASFTTFTSGTAQKVESTVPKIIKDAIIVLVGHWTNYQHKLENDGFITRVPLAVKEMLDSERLFGVR